MKILFSVLLFIIGLISPFDGTTGCKVKNIEGIWYGSFISQYGNEYKIVIEIKSFDNCTFDGTLRWPSYYNSMGRIQGTVDGDSINFSEIESLQGYFVSKSPVFKGIIRDKNLSGFTLDNEIETGEFSLGHSSTLSKSEINIFNSALEDSKKKFGITQILGSTRVDTATIIEKQLFFDSLSYSMTHAVVSKGKVGFNELYFPTTLTILYPVCYRMDSDFQGSPYISSSTREKNWNYDPTYDKVFVTEQSDSSDYRMSTYFVKSIRDSMEIESIKDAYVSGIPSFRFLFAKGSERRAIYLDTTNYIIIREEVESRIQEYHDPFQFEGVVWIKKMVQFDGTSTSIFEYDSIYIDSTITEDYFEIPEEFKSKIDRSSEFEKEYFSKAEDFFQSKDFTSAIEFYDKAININSENYEYYNRRALAKKESGDYYGALSDLEQSLRINPNSIEMINQKGTIKYALGDYTNSLVDFQNAIRLDSSFATAYFNIAFIKTNKREYRVAKNYYDFAIKYDSSNANYHFNRGIVLNELNAYDSALLDFDKSIQLEHPQVFDVYNRKGVSYYRKESYDSAAFYFSKAKEGSDKNIFDKNLAHALFKANEYKEAAKIFESIVEESESDHTSLNLIGLCYYRLNDFDGAIFYFDKAISIASNYSTYYQNRGFASKQMGKYTKAIEDFTQAIRLNPDDAENYFQVGYINEIQHNKFDACLYYKKAMEKGYEATEKMISLCDLPKSDE